MSHKEVFSSRWALLLATLGMAIGTGNIWRFPRIAAKNGGGAFIIAWLFFLFLWSLPLLISEFAIGKKTRYGTVGAFGKLLGEKFTWMGSFVGFCSTAIMFYYSVVTGWCFKYFIASVSGGLAGVESMAYWTQFTTSLYQPILFHLLAIAIGAFVIYQGVVQGIERVNKIIIPALLILLVLAVIRALTLPGALNGLNFLFQPNWSALANYQVWLEALSQSAWSTGAGWGLILTYAVYLKDKEDIVVNSFVTVFGDYSASLLAGLAIFPSVFALAPALGLVPEEVMQYTGPASTGLTFIWIPQLFKGMALGSVFTAIFFLALSFAAFSSLIAMIELVTRIFMDAGMQRKTAILLVATSGFLLGIPSAINMTFFENQDWVWGVGLMLSGFFVAFAVIRFGPTKFRNELINTEGNDLNVGTWFDYLIKYVIPIEFLVLIGWWFYQSVTAFDRGGWWNPFHTFSLGTCVFQWGLVIAAFLVFNRTLYKKTLMK
ncbi:MAG TPA: sodium-dependent transporter [bacterium]